MTIFGAASRVEEMVRSLYASVVVDQVEIREMKERGRIDLVMRTKDRPD